VAAALCNDPSHADLLARFEQMSGQILALTQQVQALTLREAEREKAHAAETAALRAKVEDLEARLKKDSSNSSRPPSSDSPYKTRERRTKPSGRKQGGQPGHEGTARAEFSAERIDDVKDHRPPACCTGCGGTDLEDAGVFRWQVVEIPEIRPTVTEHRVHTLRCKKCGREDTGAMPADVARSNFGPRTHALAATLTGGFRLTRREAVRVFDEVFNVDLSTGALSDMEGRVAAALEESYRAVQRALREGEAAHIDETPWKQRRVLHWLWNATFGKLAVFRIDRRRDRGASRRLFAGKFHGVRIVDRLAVHDDVKPDRRQICWAHLDRDFAAFVDGPAGRRRFGRSGRAIAAAVFRSWDLFEAGRIDRPKLREIADRLESRVRLLLTGAAGHAAKRVRRFAAHLLRQIGSLFVYAAREKVEPSNNTAERSLRGPVLWRKGSYGTQSERGSRFAERMLTAKHCLRAQGRDLLAFLVEALRAHVHGHPPPSLLPPP